MNLNERIKYAREKAGFSNQSRFAEKFGVSSATVSGWEHAKHNPTADRLIKIAEVCHVSLDWLVFGKDPPKTVDQLTSDDLLVEICNRPDLYKKLKTKEATNTCEDEQEYARKNDPLLTELVKIYQKLPEEDRINILKTAKGLEAFNESRTNVGGGSDSGAENCA